MKSLIITAILFLGSFMVAHAQGDGKTYYDAAKTKPKEVFTYKSVYNFDPSNPGKGQTEQVKHGPYFEYYENGKLKISGAFKDNQKHGEWKYFDDKQNLTKTEKYNLGKITD